LERICELYLITNCFAQKIVKPLFAFSGGVPAIRRGFFRNKVQKSFPAKKHQEKNEQELQGAKNDQGL